VQNVNVVFMQFVSVSKSKVCCFCSFCDWKLNGFERQMWVWTWLLYTIF